ncbi:hypothetical protein HK102_003814 [Quaeritorhiza haematococci]|nr:hypothetical protein HK102_003814 [Quaeritorhiza haematococci]
MILGGKPRASSFKVYADPPEPKPNQSNTPTITLSSSNTTTSSSIPTTTNIAASKPPFKRENRALNELSLGGARKATRLVDKAVKSLPVTSKEFKGSERLGNILKPKVVMGMGDKVGIVRGKPEADGVERTKAGMRDENGGVVNVGEVRKNRLPFGLVGEGDQRHVMRKEPASRDWSKEEVAAADEEEDSARMYMCGKGKRDVAVAVARLVASPCPADDDGRDDISKIAPVGDVKGVKGSIVSDSSYAPDSSSSSASPPSFSNRVDDAEEACSREPGRHDESLDNDVPKTDEFKLPAPKTDHRSHKTNSAEFSSDRVFFPPTLPESTPHATATISTSSHDSLPSSVSSTARRAKFTNHTRHLWDKENFDHIHNIYVNDDSTPLLLRAKKRAKTSSSSMKVGSSSFSGKAQPPANFRNSAGLGVPCFTPSPLADITEAFTPQFSPPLPLSVSFSRDTGEMLRRAEQLTMATPSTESQRRPPLGSERSTLGPKPVPIPQLSLQQQQPPPPPKSLGGAAAEATTKPARKVSADTAAATTTQPLKRSSIPLPPTANRESLLKRPLSTITQQSNTVNNQQSSSSGVGSGGNGNGNRIPPTRLPVRNGRGQGQIPRDSLRRMR